ncbi:MULTISPECIES: sugar porter family MFS transporter [Pseudomonadaceae]|jgi:SP family galactose:H+ symporter-like MFS transporter|uniref:MFS transporter n=2 Tax=Pseudomonadaceae TaxID=135621 RepID=A0ABX3IW57_9PSED|nr:MULTISPECIES: sugar porter family MFS transporter [Pseudomonas]MBA1260725.1 sugar porter family MFS transporter [Pseudomonas psychrotolerans]MBH3331694.1 sugar porter family MFS transporter [Pseudomonas oryzihabitans]MCI1009845.1 sugar porter family MFS transporter [Pseudomonas oryzihabitans]MDU4056271.1 sugar porter family MFS transporter [Pseudomonas oryzihabitans]NMZ45388.1 sugar porter family MFS transporter [Pseudomonas oryzihabitans]
MSNTTTHADGHVTEKAQPKAIFACLMAALAGLMFGLDIGVISGATKFIQQEFQISDQVIEWIVSSMMAGAALGALGAGSLSAKLGRKKSLMLGAILFVIGSILCGLATSPTMLIFARFLLGLAIGIASFTAPLYLAEVAPENIRGSMISLYQLMITAGILIAFLSNTAFSYYEAWRWMLGIIAIPGVLFLIGVFALPDSPRWLIMAGRKQEAIKVLHKLRGDEKVIQQEVAEIEEQLKVPQKGWSLFKENANFRRSVGLGVLLQVVQQFTGMNVVMYYAPRIFEGMGYDTAAQMWFTAAVGLTNVLATFIAIFLVDKWGRKPILYTGFVVMAVGLGVVGTMLGMGNLSHGQQTFTVVMLLIFIVGFAMSAGPLIWTLCSEVQPLKGRDFGIGCSTFTNWIANMIVGATFLTMLGTLGQGTTFWIYAGLNVVFIFLVFLLVPETKGVTLERIERNLMQGKRLRDLGQ